MESNHNEPPYLKVLKLMNSIDNMKYCKVCCILRYHVPIRIIFRKRFAHHFNFFTHFAMSVSYYHLIHIHTRVNCENQGYMI